MSDLLRMPDGVMDYLENGTTPVRVAEEECKAAARDPRSYEAALEHLTDPNRKPSVRMTGRPIMTILAEALGEED